MPICLKCQKEVPEHQEDCPICGEKMPGASSSHKTSRRSAVSDPNAEAKPPSESDKTGKTAPRQAVTPPPASARSIWDEEKPPEEKPEMTPPPPAKKSGLIRFANVAAPPPEKRDSEEPPAPKPAPGKSSSGKVAIGDIRKFQLVVFDVHGQKVHTFALKEGANLVGTSSPQEGHHPPVDLSIVDHDKFISRRHAEIIVHRGELKIRDMGSRNGTEIRGQLIKGEPVSVEIGELIVFARIRCKIAEIRSWS